MDFEKIPFGAWRYAKTLGELYGNFTCVYETTIFRSMELKETSFCWVLIQIRDHSVDFQDPVRGKQTDHAEGTEHQNPGHAQHEGPQP